MKIYTRTGDTGQTSLFGGKRVAKDDGRIDAYGTVDELNSFIGLARVSWPESSIDGELLQVQNDLFDIGAQLAAPGNEMFDGAAADRVAALESAIDQMESVLEPLRSFILPGGSAAASHLHIARTVCRRAERLVVALQAEDEATMRTIAYLNRLSDYLFVAARAANAAQGRPDVIWSSGR